MVREALDEGENPQDIINAMIDALKIVGDKFFRGEIFIPEMLMASKSMSKSLDILKPLLLGNPSKNLGICIIGTVEGDLHDIGKNLVSIMIQSVGFTVIDLGEDVEPDEFVNAVKANKNVKIVACSGLLSTTMKSLKNTVAALKSSGIKGFKVMVGGAPVTQEFADEIGADAYAGDAALKARKLILGNDDAGAPTADA